MGEESGETSEQHWFEFLSSPASVISYRRVKKLQTMLLKKNKKQKQQTKQEKKKHNGGQQLYLVKCLRGKSNPTRVPLILCLVVLRGPMLSIINLGAIIQHLVWNEENICSQRNTTAYKLHLGKLLLLKQLHKKVKKRKNGRCFTAFSCSCPPFSTSYQDKSRMNKWKNKPCRSISFFSLAWRCRVLESISMFWSVCVCVCTVFSHSLT